MPASAKFAPLADTTLELWNQVLATNLTATFLLAKAAVGDLERARGAIVTIASTRAHMSEPGTLAYSASKGGVVALTHALAITLAPKVRVNCVSPGWIDTGKHGPLKPSDHAQHPVGRVGRVEDVAAAVAYLLSDAAGFVTGRRADRGRRHDPQDDLHVSRRLSAHRRHASNIDTDDLRPDVSSRDADPSYRHRQLEAPRTGAAWVDVENTLLRLDRRLMRVPEHNGREAGGSRIEIELRDVVKHPKHELTDLDCFRHGEVGRPGLGIDVAAHCNRGGNGAQLVDDIEISDVAGVDDEFRPTQRIKCLGSHEPMRIRDNANNYLAIIHGAGMPQRSCQVADFTSNTRLSMAPVSR